MGSPGHGIYKSIPINSQTVGPTLIFPMDQAKDILSTGKLFIDYNDDNETIYMFRSTGMENIS